MAKNGTTWYKELFDLLKFPAFPTTEDIHALAEVEKAKNPPTINLTKNIFVTKVRNRRTGEIIDISKDEYEILETEESTTQYEGK